MTLRATFKVPPHIAADVSISRITNTDRAFLSPNTISTYDWIVITDYNDYHTKSGTVEHRYGDGAVELMRLVLNAWKDQQ